MNFTADDTNPDLAYSLSPADPDLPAFFDQSYHAAAADGASFNVSFAGSAVYIYGSKGPQHANYDIVYDGTLLEGLSAAAPTPAFQQPLFSHTWDASDPTSSMSATHFVSLTVRYNGAGGTWLDVDYATFTLPGSEPESGSDAATVQGVATSQPWDTNPSPAPTTSPSLLPIPTSSSASQAMPISTILAILFGTITGLALLILLAYFILTRRPTQKPRHTHLPYPGGRRDNEGTAYSYTQADATSPRASQARFRDTSILPTSLISPSPSPASPTSLTSGSSYSRSAITASTLHPLTLNPLHPPRPPFHPSHPHSPGLSTIPSLGSLEHAPSPARSTFSLDSGVGSVSSGPIRFNHVYNAGSLGSLRTLLNPGHRRRGGDADSTRSDFLQV